MTPIPLVDLSLQHLQIADEVQRAMAQVMADASFILGRQVAEFETAFAQHEGIEHCVGVANGTDAIELALRAIGVGPGDDVILPANTFIATALAVVRAGAKPVLVDCDPTYQLIDPAQVERRITKRTRAIIPVHLFGQMARLEDIAAAAPRIAVLEDAAQAQGARSQGRAPGSFGSAAATSFYPSKNLGAYGDAGAVLCRSGDVARKIRALRNYGSEKKYDHPEMGFNSRLDTLQAVVLLAKLHRLDAWNEARRMAAGRYDELLKTIPGVELPRTNAGNLHIWYLYVVRVPRRDAVLSRLQEAGIGAGVHYPVPIHLQGAFRYLGHRAGDFPVAEQAAREILSLPMFPEITVDQQARVAEQLRKAIHAG